VEHCTDGHTVLLLATLFSFNYCNLLEQLIAKLFPVSLGRSFEFNGKVVGLLEGVALAFLHLSLEVRQETMMK
jgi:hypothetical protein